MASIRTVLLLFLAVLALTAASTFLPRSSCAWGACVPVPCWCNGPACTSGCHCQLGGDSIQGVCG